MTHPHILPSTEPEPAVVVAICVQCGHPFVFMPTGAFHSDCGGTLRALKYPTGLERYLGLKQSGKWKQLRTVKVDRV